MSQELESTFADLPEFSVNEELLAKASELKQSWYSLKERLEKIKTSKDSLSPIVYERVLADYEHRYGEARDRLLIVKSDVDQELSTLSATHDKLQEQMVELQNNLEELEFRHSLGEFQEQQFEKESGLVRKKISTLGTMIKGIKDNINQYEEIFSSESELMLEDEESDITGIDLLADQDEPAKKIAENRVDSIEPKTDASGYVLEEDAPNYFADTSSTQTGNASGETLVEDHSAKATKITNVRPAKLVHVNGSNAGEAITLLQKTSLGRAESNTIPLNDPKSSRQHAQILKKGAEFILVDLNSSNGTYVNGQRIDEYVLSDGDEVKIGDSLMQFEQ